MRSRRISATKRAKGPMVGILTASLVTLIATSAAVNAEVTLTAQWEQVYDRGYGADYGYVITQAPNGNIVIAGESVGAGTGFDALVACYDHETGAEIWTETYNAANARDRNEDMVVDDDSSVYAAGIIRNPGSGYSEELPGQDLRVVKLDENGNQTWETIYHHGWEKLARLALADDGTFWAGVTGGGDFNGFDWVVLQLDRSTGEILAEYRIDSPLHNDDEMLALEVDTDGDLYLAGYMRLHDTGGTSDLENPGNDLVVIKLAPDGTVLWEYTYDGPEGNADVAHYVLPCADGGAFVQGSSWNTAGDRDAVLIRLDAGGLETWRWRYASDASGDDFAAGIAQYPSGDLAVAVRTYAAGTGYHTTVWRLTPEMEIVWETRLGGPEAQILAYRPVIDVYGATYLAGVEIGETGFHGLVVKLGPDGTRLWRAEQRITGALYGNTQMLTVSTTNAVFTVGYSWAAADPDILVTSLNQGIPPVADAGDDLTAVLGGTVSLDGTGSTDPDGEIVRYEWTLPNGTTLIGPKVDTSFDAPGLLAVTLTVWDNAGNLDQDVLLVDVLAPDDALWALIDIVKSWGLPHGPETSIVQAKLENALDAMTDGKPEVAVNKLEALRSQISSPGYDKLTEEQKDFLTTWIEAIIAALEEGLWSSPASIAPRPRIIKAAPNPASISKGVTFEASGPDVGSLEVSIYALDGTRLYMRGPVSEERIVWPATTTAGEPVSRGPYIYVLTVRDTAGRIVEIRRGTVIVAAP